MPRRVFYTSRNDKVRMESFLAMTRGLWQESRVSVQTSELGMEAH
ncbi:MAG: hypothetical protein UIH18_01760 [Fibrobacteraceae bacterium]|nr:hypothetical protein [Fibrobacteraceae bacterium]